MDAPPAEPPGGDRVPPRRKHRRKDPPTSPCGAVTRASDRHPCRRPAGWGTDHVGQGRCRFHGGATPVTTGQYSTVVRTRIRALQQDYAKKPYPYDLRQEIAFVRALLASFLEEGPFSAETFYPLATHLAETISRIAERGIRIEERYVIPLEVLRRNLTTMAEMVEASVADPDVLQRIHDRWSTIQWREGI